MTQLLLPLLLLVAMYFILVRPQQEALRKAREFRAALKAGDKVINSTGFFATIVEFEGDDVILEIAPKVRVKSLREQIVQYQSGQSELPGADKEKKG
jgi:preprotein translocase subunit YajC